MSVENLKALSRLAALISEGYPFAALQAKIKNPRLDAIAPQGSSVNAALHLVGNDDLALLLGDARPQWRRRAIDELGARGPAALKAVAAWMTGSITGFSLIAISGRQLSHHLDTFEMMMYRSAIGWLAVLTVATLQGLHSDIGLVDVVVNNASVISLDGTLAVTQKRYDLIVLDTPPTKHALDFLTAPKRKKTSPRPVRQLDRKSVV